MNHQFYRDDLEIYEKNKDDLEGLLSTVKRFSDDIGMQFGLEKCSKYAFKKGSEINSKEMTLDINTENTALEHNKTYEYLGINEAKGINHTIKKKL